MQECNHFRLDTDQQLSEQDLLEWDINPNLEIKTTQAGVEDVNKILTCISNVPCSRIQTQAPKYETGIRYVI